MTELTPELIAPSAQRWGRMRMTDELLDAWRQAHIASQAAAELGKSWAIPKGDDSHSAFRWRHDDKGRGLLGAPTATEPSYACSMAFEGFALSVDEVQGEGTGRTAADLAIEGRTLRDLTAWVEQQGETLCGPRKQPAIPAPDLPDHPTHRGAPFTNDDAAMNDLASLYDGTADLLDKLRGAVRGATLGPTIVWPHHFDMAALAEVETDGGAAVKTIGVGLAVPDPIDQTGYWYVSPWRTSGGYAGDWHPLPLGRWHDADSADPASHRMGVLPVRDLLAAGGTAEQPALLAAFIASAFTTCREILS